MMAESKAPAYRFESVWQSTSPELQQEIVAFWVKNGAVSAADELVTRAKQAIIIMRAVDGSIAAVSTAVLEIIPRLQQPLYYYRTFCAEAHRGYGTSRDMMKASQAALHQYNLKLPEPESIGIHIELENELLAKQYPTAQWAQTGFTFIGYSPNGYVVRAYYFPGFTLKPRPTR